MNQPLLQASELLQLLLAYWWPFCRIMALFSLAPLFNHKALPPQVRILLALALTLGLAGSLPPPPEIEPLSLFGLAVALEQVAFGLLLGLGLQMVFAVYTLVGGVVATPMGLSMAQVNDPVNAVSSSPILYQVYFALLVFLFFTIDGHLITASILYQSFIHWPIGSGLHYDGFATVLQAFAWVLSAAALIGAPVVFCMMLVQFCFGLLNRISPAMNLFSLGFPIAITSGLLLIYFTLPNIAESYLHLTRELLDNLDVMLRSDSDG